MLTPESREDVFLFPPPIKDLFQKSVQNPAEKKGLSEFQRQTTTTKLVREHLMHLGNESASDDFDKIKFFREAAQRVTLKHKNEVWMEKMRYDGLSYIIQNNTIKPVLQIGPSCGIAALTMALKVLNESQSLNQPEFQQILEVSKSHGLTNHGEMFSAHGLLDLALKLSPNISGFMLSKGMSCKEKKELILKHLIQKHVVLIPYDKGPNNEPILKKGLKAHWAVLTGFMIIASRLTNDLLESLVANLEENNVFEFKKSTEVDYIFNCLETNYSLEGDFCENHELFVFARQGKSLRLHLWHLSELLHSNDQLVLDPQEECYLLPEGGVLEGLCGKIVILKGKST